MEKGIKRIVIGVILIAVQVASYIGNTNAPLTSADYLSQMLRAEATGLTALAMDIAGFLGYNLIGIIGCLFIVSAILSRGKEKRQQNAEKKRTAYINSFTDEVARDMAQKMIVFAANAAKIPGDNAVINRLKELTAWPDDHAVRQLGANWMRANSKLKTVKAELSALQNAEEKTAEHERIAKENAQGAAKSFTLFLLEFTPKIKKCTKQEVTEKLKSFLSDIEPMYK